MFWRIIQHMCRSVIFDNLFEIMWISVLEAIIWSNGKIDVLDVFLNWYKQHFRISIFGSIGRRAGMIFRDTLTRKRCSTRRVRSLLCLYLWKRCYKKRLIGLMLLLFFPFYENEAFSQFLLASGNLSVNAMLLWRWAKIGKTGIERAAINTLSVIFVTIDIITSSLHAPLNYYYYY